MQIKNIVATIAAFSAASAIAGPLLTPNESVEVAERDSNKIDAASINHMAHEALSRAGGDEKPTDEQIRELINKVTGAATATATAKRQNNANQWAWDNPYWNRYSWSYNGLTANYYCYTGGSYCYYAQWNRSYNGYLWWGYYNAYSWPVNYSRNWKTWNYWGW